MFLKINGPIFAGTTNAIVVPFETVEEQLESLEALGMCTRSGNFWNYDGEWMAYRSGDWASVRVCYVIKS